jgi:uncharacterized damage-inducible protein DinB
MAVDVTRDSLISDLMGTWRINERINQYLIDHLCDEAWNAKPPGGKGRTIAAVFAHIHNVRLMWLKAAAKGTTLPEKAEGKELNRDEAKRALAESAAAITKLLDQGLATGRIPGFPPSAAAFLGYLLAHDAHHRGQVTMLARQVGHPVPPQAGFGLWEWNTRAKEAAAGDD